MAEFDTQILDAFDGFAEAVSNDSVAYETVLGGSLGRDADYFFPELPTLQALARASIETPNGEEHMTNADFLRSALNAIITSRKERGARL